MKVEHHPTPTTLPEKQFTEAYKVKMSSLFSYYIKLRGKVQINIPELHVRPEDPRAVDIICGFLSSTTLFSKTELQRLLETLDPKKRLDVCLKYFMKYEKEFNMQWD